ncbi:MAG: 3-keto-disaccharide hydrolase [Candidatus Hydrogenedentales bacterium]|jgi:hypothetical protein
MKRSVINRNTVLALSVFLGLCFAMVPALHAQDAAGTGWLALFNGKDLDDWVIKFKGCPLGENYKDTFGVEEGLLKVRYDHYDSFDNRFGHIFYKDKFSHYKLRVEYRFVDDQVKGGPGWAFRNNGVMIHCQPPETMSVDQDFPASIEVQLLGGDGKKKRSTANLCTPGTHVVIEDELITRHCTDSRSKTYHGDQWVTVEIEVRGNELIQHLIDNEVVLEYEKPQLDEKDADAQALIKAGFPIMVSEGYIALQAESHPTQFRRIELLPLDTSDSAQE